LSEHTTTQCFLFPELFDRPTLAQFDQERGSSDGGAIMLKAAERRLGIISALADCMEDDRQEGKVRHQLEELLTQRVMAIACGYEDGNNAAQLASDPVHKLLVGRDPRKADDDLASQSTLSRFENSVDRKELFSMSEALAERVIERHRKRLHGRARRITIDLDPTDDPTHGQQQLSFFKCAVVSNVELAGRGSVNCCFPCCFPLSSKGSNNTFLCSIGTVAIP
jgi:Transposase DDE domain group 1